MTPEEISYRNTEAIKAQLLGKSVVAADLAAQTLTLSDGTVLTVEPNRGSCCENGDFFLEALTLTPHAITGVEVSESFREGRNPEVFHLFIYTAGVAVGQELLRVAGHSGNEYYGMGFKLLVGKV